MEKSYTYKDWRALGNPAPEDVLKPYDTVSKGVLQNIIPDHSIEDTDLYVQERICTDVFGNDGLYNTFARPSENAPFFYMGLCQKGAGCNAHPDTARKIFIISQFAAETEKELKFHLAVAGAAAWREWRSGMLPIVPHLYFPQFLNDSDPLQRDYAIAAGHTFMRDCEAVKVYEVDGIISEGMRSDIDYATLVLGIEPTIVNLTREEAEEFTKTGEL